ncbi:amino acid ABC transporter permease [Tabrizicola oligotrophica]|uniref:ABC transporter permease subunit n=1 Tax=Tabrizicola oligotrophica TaxID=2710650 RepID=A0A6M0QUY6_9RHOB|nr:ABC transporter permease subunit [Tabrizicola oligotrophica]NEY91227.1 ABC transporter permease subunit [Tabrizicola oligotrophica]
MTLATDAPKDVFRLSMLIYDTRYRSYTIQIAVLVLLLLFLGWITDNTIQNLAERGKDISFNFLWQRAGYDIDQQLIPYTNDSTHGRATVIGILNTLVVAIIGCLLATVIGVVAGVLRLSKNWLVARIMTVYVEVFRNIPVVLWIIVASVFLTETQPQPRDFKVTDEMIMAGEEPKASMLFGAIAITGRSTDIPAPVLSRPLPTLEIATVPVSLSFLAFLAVVVVSVMANRRFLTRVTAVQEETGVRPVTWWKSLLILFGPSIALLIAMGLHLEYPELKGFNFKGGISINHAFSALLVALSLYTGAFIAENVRAGIMAISRGQSEAAFALGLRPGRAMKLVILPQALRVIIPPLISQYLNLTKNTSLGIAVGYLDLRGTLGGITMNQTGREMECMVLMMGIYLVISLIVSSIMNAYNNAVKLRER